MDIAMTSYFKAFIHSIFRTMLK